MARPRRSAGPAKPVEPPPPPSAAIPRGPIGRFVTGAGDNAFQTWVWTTIAMFVLIGLAVLLDIESVVFTGALADGTTVATEPGGPPMSVAKQVGYLWAANWALHSVLIVPLMVTFAFRTWSAMPGVLDSIADAGMARGRDFTEVSDEALVASWTRAQRRCAAAFWAIFIGVMAFILWDWWEVVLRPILDPPVLAQATLAHPSMEFDWSIACLYEGRAPGACGPLIVFGFAAYLLIAGFATALAFATVVGGLMFVVFLSGATGGEPWRLAAVPGGATDSRGGFGRFSGFFTPFLLLTLCVVVGCLLMIVQNAYLRDPGSPDILRFAFGSVDEFSEKAGHFNIMRPLDEAGLIGWLFEPTRNIYENPQTGIGTLLIGFTSLIAVGVSWGLLRAAAQSARSFSLDHLETLARERKVTPQALKRRLKEMEFWPLAWLKLNQMLVLNLCLIAALISYRLILIPIAVVALQVGKSVIKLFWSRGPERG